jgi:hypothetical protein
MSFLYYLSTNLYCFLDFKKFTHGLLSFFSYQKILISPVRHNVNMIHGPPRYLEVHGLSYIVLIIMPHVQAMIEKINWDACGPQEKNYNKHPHSTLLHLIEETSQKNHKNYTITSLFALLIDPCVISSSYGVTMYSPCCPQHNS